MHMLALKYHHASFTIVCGYTGMYILMQILGVCIYYCLIISSIANPYMYITRHTHSVNASCSYIVHEDIICIHTNGSLEGVALL